MEAQKENFQEGNQKIPGAMQLKKEEFCQVSLKHGSQITTAS